MGLMDFRPLLQVTVDGVPLSLAVFGLISSVRVTDEAGLSSDTCEITFANLPFVGGYLMPEPGAEISIAFGYLGTFRAMGVFVADEVEESSPPRQISVTGRAKSMGATAGGQAPIHQQKTRSWPAGLTVGSIVATIASDNGLKAAVTQAAASIVPGHLDQIDESDMSLLTRIAVTFDLVAKPAGGTLFVGRRADGTTASGGSTPTISLWQRQVSRWSMRRSLSEAVGTVIATWRDIEGATDVEVEVGSGEPVRRLRGRYRTEAEAKEAAEAERRRASRATESLEVELPGNPNLVAEGRVVPVDLTSAAAGAWLIETATHELDEGGYRTSLKCERPQ